MRGRFLKSTGERFSLVTFGTFHAVFYSFVRAASPENSRLITPEQRRAVLTHLLSMEGIDSQCEDPDSLADAAALAISLLRIRGNDHARESSSFRLAAAHFKDPAIPDKIRKGYETWMADHGYIDFDDIALRCESLCRTRAGFLENLQNQYRYILVDEFQDISPTQYRILRIMAEKGERNFFAVGDDDQAIYSFRGASPQSCRQFLTDFPDAERILLRVNYRCSQPILEAADLVIRENRNRFEKKTTASRADGKKPAVLSCASEAEEIRLITGMLQARSLKEQRNTAVILRNRILVNRFGEAFSEAGIPIRQETNTPNRERMEAFHLVESYFACALLMKESSPRLPRQHFYRIMNVPERYFLRAGIPAEGVSFPLLEDIYRGQPAMIHTIRVLQQDLITLSRLKPPLALRYLRRSMGIEPALCEGKEENRRKKIRAALDELESLGGKAGSLREFSRAASQNAIQYSSGTERPDGVRLCTMHAAKGLEFSTVILPDLGEGVIPCRQASSPDDIEEERRLLYVAMTRAREELILLYVRGGRSNPQRPSRFLKPLGVDAEYI